MKTLLHKNLNKGGLIAITQRSLVVGYCQSATLANVDLKEDAKKAAFTRGGGKRTVHLWARGELVDVVGFIPKDGRSVEVSARAFPTCTDVVNYSPLRDNFMHWHGGVEYTGSDFATVSATEGMTAI